MKIIVLLGGISPEREVSLATGKAIVKALKKIDYEVIKMDPKNFTSYFEMIKEILLINPDMVFLALHGSLGENGKIQSLLEINKIPYTGSGPKSSAICMDKNISMTLAQKLNIPIPEFFYYQDKEEIDLEELKQKLGLPFVIKPNDAGSSVGITIIKEFIKKDILTAFNFAKKYSNKVIFQKFIEGNELTVSILGSKTLPVVEIRPKQGWYDFKNKYTDGKTQYICPAPLPDEQTQKIKNYARRIYKYLECFAYARIDFRYDNNTFYFLEINTLPGMTSLSLTPKAALQAGLSFEQLITKIINLSKERKYD